MIDLNCEVLASRRHRLGEEMRIVATRLQNLSKRLGPGTCAAEHSRLRDSISRTVNGIAPHQASVLQY